MKKTSILFTVFCTLLFLGLIGTPFSSHELLASPFISYQLDSQGEGFPNLGNLPIESLKAPSPILIPPSPSGEYLAIVVDNGLWGTPAVQTAVTTYRTDLNYTGYNTILHTAAIASVQALRLLLQNWYSTNNIIGAVLIGPVPYARYYHPANGSFSAETFVCDLFLMDLDGLWWDTNMDTIYDRHNATGGGDIYPEIYVGRIDASTRTLGGASNANNIIMLLNRIHTYRTGGVARTHRALTYIDDDWQSWADGTFDNWPAWLNNVYPTRTDIHTPSTWTNATDWLNNRIIQDYEWAHLCAHSGAGPGTHYFGPGGVGEGTVASAQIHSQT
ncbi:MAG: C25 family cysteine peptidase, partial [Candidatus Thorarchaeota archaeon]